ncbi:glycerol-3-phosphate dehydrogenase C-terminal domain-containing protein, partial [Cupriavidus sp. KB_39]
GSIAGCRPLVAPPGGKTLEIKRNHEIHVADDGLVTIVGGKLTTSRHMAEQTIDAAQRVIGKRGKCRTKSAYLLGAAGYDAQAIVASGGMSAHLGERYGTEARFVSDILQADAALGRPIVEGLPHTEAEVVYAVRHELAGTVDDVLSRRMRARLMARDASAHAAPRVGQILQAELGLSESAVARQVSDYLAAVALEKSVLMGEAA